VKKPTLLITGATGKVGTCLWNGLRDEYDLRGLDLHAPKNPTAEPFFVGSLEDADLMRRAMEGVETVIHLAATPGEAAFVENLVPNNIVGLHNTFEAAQTCGVRRIVFASTCQVVTGGYPMNQTVTIQDPPRPLSAYGVTKAFGETLGRWYHEKYGLEFIAIRIGWFLQYDDEKLQNHDGARNLWLSPQDAVRLFRLAVEREGIGYGVVFGTSFTEHEWLSRREAKELLGYEPEETIPAR
jgi:nucleoside-diphosphate-sugar epimerase